jgi:putative ATP-dependent endonuclease of the OLD family
VRSGEKITDPERIILSISIDSALEIYTQLSNVRRHKRDIELLNTTLKGLRDRYRFDEDLKNEEKFRDILQYSLMRGMGNSALLHKLMQISKKSSSFEEFSDAIKNIETDLQVEIKKAQSEPLKNKIGTFSGEEILIPNYARNLLLQLSKIKVLYLTERREPIGKDEAERLLSLKVRRGGPEVLQNIQETVSALLGVKIDAFRGEETAELDVDNFLVEVNGSGIREALRLILDYEFKQPNILLIEEPEVHLHPALETSVMQYLKRISEKCQVFVTTHSTNFLDTAEMKNIYLVSRINSTQIQHIDFDEAEAVIPKELGMRLSSLFMYDRLAFVEGPSDEAIIRELASTLDVNLNQYNVGFIHMGGIRNFTHYAAEETLTFLTRRQVKLWFIIDRDEKRDDEIAKMKDRLGDKARLLSLNRREIENYLLLPRAILEFIKLKNRMAGKDTKIAEDAEKISQLMNSSAENLKQFIINKRIAEGLHRPVYPTNSINYYSGQESVSKELASKLEAMIKLLEDRKKEIERYSKEEQEYVESIWNDKKFEIIPGDMLLDSVCKKFGTSFNKMQDGKRLASLMKDEEIDPEIKMIIKEIGS